MKSEKSAWWLQEQLDGTKDQERIHDRSTTYNYGSLKGLITVHTI